MSDPERELLELGRSALDPTPHERAALRARIDAAVAAGAAAPMPRAWRWTHLAGGAGIAIVSGAILWLALSSGPAPERSREPAERPAATVIEPPAPAIPLEPAPTEVVERVPPDLETAPGPPRERAARVEREPTDSLAAELAIVSAARRALARGDGEEAAAALARHAREFPEGALTEERSALEVLALCATGERARAVVAARAFLARYPRSVSSSSVRSSCAASTLEP